MTKDSKLYVTLMAMNCGLGFFTRYYLSIFNSLKTYLEENVFPEESKGAISFLAAGPPLGAAIISLFTGSLAKQYGRRKIFMLSDIFSVIGVCLTLSSLFTVFLVGRIVTGFALGINFSLASVYIIEIAPAALKGSLGSFPTIFMSIGITFAYALAFCVPNYIEEGVEDHTWRFLMMIPGIVYFLRFLLFIFVFKEDTPLASLMILKDKEQSARAVKKIYKNQAETEAEILRLNQFQAAQESKKQITLKQLFFSKNYRRAFWMGNFIAALQMLSGLTPIVLYSSTVFKEGLADPHTSYQPKVLTLLFGISLSLGSILSSCTTKKLNRKPTLIWGYVFVGFFSILYGIIGFAGSGDHIGAKIMIILWGFPFGITVSPITFIYLSELLPEIGYAFAIFVYWVFSYSCSQMFVGISEVIGFEGIFLIFGAFCWIGALILKAFMIESKGKTKEELVAAYAGKLIVPDENQVADPTVGNANYAKLDNLPA